MALGLTDIQKVMIEQICESISPADGADSARFIDEAKSLSVFFYEDESHTDQIIEYMKELGFVSN